MFPTVGTAIIIDVAADTTERQIVIDGGINLLSRMPIKC